MKCTIAIATITLFIGGCATPPTQQELAAADYGTYPDNFEQIIKNHMTSILKDPDSARFQFLNNPKKGWNGLGGKKFGYVSCVNINAKNSYGGYVGSRMSYFMIRNGKIIDFSHGDGGLVMLSFKGFAKNSSSGQCPGGQILHSII